MKRGKKAIKHSNSSSCRTKQERIADDIYIDFLKGVPSEDACVIAETLCEVIDALKNEKGEEESSEIGVILGLEHSKDWSKLRELVFYEQDECDYIFECDAPTRSGDYCCTSNFVNCPYYKKPEKPRKRGPIGKKFEVVKRI